MVRRFGRRGWAAVGLALAALLLVGALGLGAPAARAEEDSMLRIQVTVRPEGLIEPGDAVLNFSVENASEEMARNVYLSSADGLISEPVGEIAPGETRTFSRQHSVTAEELEAGEILYTLSCDDPADAGVKINYSVRAQIRHSDATPAVEFTRQFSSRSVEAGAPVTVTYRVRNAGNVPLSDLQVQDALGGYVGRVDSLDVGESRTLVNRATISGDTASSATLSYRAEDGEERSEALEDVIVRVARADMESVFTAGYSAFSSNTATVVLTLTNAGDVGYRDICVIDDLYGGVIADGLTLDPGSDPLEVSRAYALRGEEGFRWRVTGVSNSGSHVDFVTDTVELPPAAQGASDALRLTVRALTPRICRAGNVTMRVSIENPGGAELRDLVLSEPSLGELYSFAALPADGAITRDFLVRVESDAQYEFSVRGADADDAEVSATAPAVEVEIASDGALPEGESERLIEFAGGSIKIGGSSTFAVLLLVSGALLLVLIVALIVATRRARLERQLKAAAERKRRREEMGRTNRFTPVRAPQNPKPRGKGRNG